MSGSYTQTPNLGLFKPTPNSDTGTWGIHLNANADVLDGTLSLTTGGTVTGPLNYTATGGTATRSLQSRAGEQLSATDFGIICDGVTDQGAQLNAAIAGLAPGSELYIPGPIYTSVTIQVINGTRLRMPPGQTTSAIIGSASLSPVVMVYNAEGGLTNVWITRNGTPASGAIGLLVFGQDVIFTRVRLFNHAIGLQCGAPASAPMFGHHGVIRCKFDHCWFWNITQHYVYLINSPEMTFYDCCWGMNGVAEPGGAVAAVTIDGDQNTTSGAGTANTLTFLRCQFNQGGNACQYVLRFVAYSSPDGYIHMAYCYSDGAVAAFIYIDPSCTLVQHLIITNNLIQCPTNSTLVSDTGKHLSSFMMTGNHVTPGMNAPTPSFYLSGVLATINSNIFNGSYAIQLDSMRGSFVGNTIGTLILSGAYTSSSFVIGGNNVGTVTHTESGNSVGYVDPLGSYGAQIVTGKSGQAGRVDFRRGSDGNATGWCGFASATDPTWVDLTNFGGSSYVRLNGTLADVMLISGVEVGRFSIQGIGAAKTTVAATAPGAGFATLAFIAGTTAGTGKLVAYCGTSTTPVTIMDNIGAGF